MTLSSERLFIFVASRLSHFVSSRSTIARRSGHGNNEGQEIQFCRPGAASPMAVALVLYAPHNQSLVTKPNSRFPSQPAKRNLR